MSQTLSYQGNGTVNIQLRAAAGAALRPIGNCQKLILSIADESKDQQNYEGGGGIIARVTRIKSVTAKITADSFSAENLALAVRGSTAANTGTAAVAAEAHAAVARGSLVLLDRLPDPAKPLTVKLGAALIAEAGNYERRRSGIYILPGAAGLADGDDIAVGYTPLADDLIQALTRSGDEYRLVFDGLNEAASGKPVVIVCHRVQFSPASALDLIDDGFGKLQLDGAVLSDESISGTGVSRYFTVRQAR